MTSGSKKTRVYLSKSYAASHSEVREAEEALKLYDCEVVQYTGGRYTDNDLLSCDIMLVIPPDKQDCKTKDNAHYYNVGRGQHDQYTKFIMKKGYQNVYIFGYHNTIDMRVEPVLGAMYINSSDSNYQTHHGKLNVSANIDAFINFPVKLKTVKEEAYITNNLASNLCNEIFLPNPEPAVVFTTTTNGSESITWIDGSKLNQGLLNHIVGPVKPILATALFL